MSGTTTNSNGDIRWPNEAIGQEVQRPAAKTYDDADALGILGPEKYRAALDGLRQIKASGATLQSALELAQYVLADAFAGNENVAELVEGYLAACLAAMLRDDPSLEMWEWISSIRYHSSSVEHGLYELIPRLAKASPAFAASFVRLAEEVLKSRKEPNARRSSDGEESESLTERWQQNRNLTDLWHGVPGWEHYWHRSQDAMLSIVSQFDIPAFVRLMSALPEPYSVMAAIFFSGAGNRFARWQVMVSACPGAFDEDGAWNGQLVLPLLLYVAQDNLRQIGRPGRAGSSRPEVDKDVVAKLVNAVVGTLFERGDAPGAAQRWAPALVQGALRSLSGAIPPYPVDAASPGFVETSLVEALVKAKGINAWPVAINFHPERWEPWCHICVRVIAHFLGSDTAVDPAEYLKSWAISVEGLGGAEGIALHERISPFHIVKQQADSYGARLLAWPIAWLPEPASAWEQAWNASGCIREVAEFGEFDASSGQSYRGMLDATQLLRLLFSIGLMTLDHIVFPQRPLSYDRRAEAARLIGLLTDAVHDMRAIDLADLGFWSGAMRHLAVRRAIWLGLDGPAAVELKLAPEVRPNLEDYVYDLKGDTEELLAFIEVALRNGVTRDQLKANILSAKIDLAAEIELALKLHKLDGRRTRFSDSQIAAAREIL